MPSKSTLKGYLLEEILAYLIRNTGYRLLVDKSQDPRELDQKGNGLVVRGRGGVHQADVLGQLHWIPAFTFPIRLFVEAKCRGGKTGIAEVRNAVGIVNDLNQNYAPMQEGSKTLIKRYSYHYALFSTSGFSIPAIDYAMAHQISLIDVSGPAFADLHRLLEDLATQLIDSRVSGRYVTKHLRMFIRQELETWPTDIYVEEEYRDFSDEWNGFLNGFRETLIRGVEQIGEFFVGMADGPYMLVFKPERASDFLDYVRDTPAHDVTITWSFVNNQERQWIIRPANNRNAYTLTFALPKEIGDWVFRDPASTIDRARNAKQQFFSSMMIYRYEEGRDYLYRLSYNAAATRDSV